MQKELNNFLIVPNNKNIEEFNFNSFILPLEDYSIGYNVYFSVDEINELSNKYNVYVIMNKLLHRTIYNFK